MSRARAHFARTSRRDVCFAEVVWIEPSASLWLEVVFHVLAQLPGARVPASLYSPWYVDYVASRLGPAQTRALGDDLAALAAFAVDHRTLSALQGLAWLWDDAEQACACADRELCSLRAEDVADPALLSALARSPAPVELLRCAALLELEAYRELPAAELDSPSLARALDALLPVARGITTTRITPLRALTRHGRVRGASIWIGNPGEGVSLAHAALQAAHEATVRELAPLCGAAHERRIERVALVLLATRIDRSPRGLRAAHRAWCEEHSVGERDLLPADLTVAERKILDACLR